MSDAGMEARIELLLAELKLPTMRRMHSRLAREVASAGGDFAAYLLGLLEEEVGERRSRRVTRRMKEARFRQVKTLEELDVAELPKGITRQRLDELASGAYMDSATNILALGGSGTGKTHLCTALGVAACRQGRRVRFFTAAELVSELEEAREKHALHRYLRRFAGLDLAIIDELGYLPIGEHGADLLFQALSERHERQSIVLNSNLAFDEWGTIFGTERLTVALLDRLTHRAHILEMNGPSYRLKSARNAGTTNATRGPD